MADSKLILDGIAWPQESLSSGLALLAKHRGFIDLNLSLKEYDRDDLMIAELRKSGVEARQATIKSNTLAASLSRLDCAALEIVKSGKKYYVLTTGRVGSLFGASLLKILSPKGEEIIINQTDLLAMIEGDSPRSIESGLVSSLKENGFSDEKTKKIEAALHSELAGSEWDITVWTLAFAPEVAIAKQATQFSVTSNIAIAVAVYLSLYLLWIASWVTIGLGALNGRLSSGWLYAWVILLVSIVPMKVFFSWLAGKVVIFGGALLRRRLLNGVLNYDASKLRAEGIGRLLARSLDSTEVESLAISGGINALVAVLELAVASIIIVGSFSGTYLFVLLFVCAALFSFLVLRLYRNFVSWNAARLDLTHECVENMLGHTTRLVQQDKALWHRKEEQRLEEYNQKSMCLDRSEIFVSVIPRVWLLLSMSFLGYMLVYNNIPIVALAIMLGAILLCYRAFTSISEGAYDLSKALLAWRNIKPIFESGRKSEKAPQCISQTKDASQGELVLSVKGLRFGYEARTSYVISSCDLKIRYGDNILLVGGSGSGKSTLAQLLSMQLRQTSGLIMLHGLDVSSLGEEQWRDKVVYVPQYNQNYILMGSFLYNLLLGDDWPPEQEKIEEVYDVCIALGLDKLLSAMPGGLLQLIGDTGWQLSHGEKSRVYIARALLQNPDVIILDESFAALDAESMRTAMSYVREKSNALMVIAHP